MKNKHRLVMLVIDFVLIAILIAFDQLTKFLSVKNLKDKDAFVLIDGVLELDYLENRGAAFGMLQNQKFFILFIGIVFMAIILFFLFKLPEKKKYDVLHILMSFIVAGGIGNMIDRVIREGSFVVDYIDFRLINFAIFNFADICVVGGVVLLLVYMIFIEGKQGKEGSENHD